MIRLEEVTKLYTRGAQQVRALDGVSLNIEKGDFLAVTGPSGSGKSTLLQLVGALDTPTAGKILFQGRSLADFSDNELTQLRRERIGFVFQFFNLLTTMSALENVMLPALLAGRQLAATRLRAEGLLHKVGLAERAEHHPDELSGGEMQRVAIARALIQKPPVLLADEPTGNLDSQSGAEVLDLLGSLHRDGQTIIMVTHDPAAAAVASDTIRLQDGRVVEDSRRADPPIEVSVPP